MIEVFNLTKLFRNKVAIDDISFEVNQGEIVGFLGPNGAGKTTTLRILSGFLNATNGTVLLANHDIMLAPLEAKKHLGYLPENVPLPNEMRIDEYLKFRAALKGVSYRHINYQLEKVKELCDLKNEGSKIIGTLSKGQRQRVGLSDAIINDPEILILDEPTVGLDPNQIRNVRSLIKSLAGKHTILLSTHLLSEVEMTCKRVLIINNGKIIISEKTDNLHNFTQGGTKVIAEIKGNNKNLLFEKISKLAYINKISAKEINKDINNNWIRFEIEGKQKKDLRNEIFDFVNQNNLQLRELYLEKSSLEEVFINLTRQENE